MQNKGAIKLFTVLLAAICAYQLMFTFKAKQVESDAKEYANNDPKKEQVYLDSISGETVYSFLWLSDFTYQEVKENEINLGLDLKGGMNVTLEISVADIVTALSNKNQDPVFIAAIKQAKAAEKNGNGDFIDTFVSAFETIDPNATLASIFDTPELRDRISFTSSNEDVRKVIVEETDKAIDNSFNILRSRIDRFGVAQPNIQKMQKKGRILVELPGVKDPERVRKLLQGTAQLEFWETYENAEIMPLLFQLNTVLAQKEAAMAPTEAKEEASAATEEEGEVDQLINAAAKGDSINPQDAMAKQMPLFYKYNIIPRQDPQSGQPYPGAVIATVHKKDTAAINELFDSREAKDIFNKSIILAWGAKAIDEAGNYFELYSLKDQRGKGIPPLDGSVITDARQDYDQTGNNVVVDMTMNSTGAKIWSNLTRDNIDKAVAITLDGYVQSAPRVNVQIESGRSEISGQFSALEGQDLANMLKSGKLPAPAHIVQEETVGPTLGQESIDAGLRSFMIAFILVLIYMFFIYSKHAGLVANIALIVNLFFIIGVLTIFGAVLTLPGIAGIVLTIGMSVDANVLIYERIQEERRAGKGLKLAITDGYKNALSAIVDGQVTTLLTGIVLAIFGSGPIQGFATTLIIGIITSFITAVFITRIIFATLLEKNVDITFASKMTDGWLRNTKIKFLAKRKLAYTISGVAILASLISLSTKGLSYGIDFQGGRTYVVRFDKEIEVEDLASSLSVQFESTPEVKTFGEDNQVKITTAYLIDEEGVESDAKVEAKLYEGCKEYLGSVSKEQFLTEYRVSSQKVGPTISDDIRSDAAVAIGFALIIIFLYILARFSKWQYGLGAIVALAHDTIIVMGLFSILDGWVPFSLDIDQAFIAAILTVLGYSINDTVVVFDRIREYLGLHPRQDKNEVVDSALNSTLRRTFSTSLSTFVVLLAIFLFGGASIQGFTFALLVGVVVGTYSSLFIATPISVDTTKVETKVLKKARR